MKILALEFSSPQRSVAVLKAGPGVAAQSFSEVTETGGQAANTMGMIEAALREAQLEREQIECVAVGLGPGSYTGIRSAIALAQGWQLARGVVLLGISTVECLAAEAQAQGLAGRVAVVIDAQRNEFYLAGYELQAGDRRPTELLRLVSRAEVQAVQEAGAVLVGPEVRNWFPGGRLILPSAATLARLALGRPDFIPGEKLEPIYLRETKFVKAPPSRIVPF